MPQDSASAPAHVVIDVSVVVAAVSPNEHRHAESLEFLHEVHRRRVVLDEPPHFLLELYAVLNRSPRQLRELGFMTEDRPIVMQFRPLGTVELERFLGWASSTFPGKCPTRGADLAYVSVALETGSPLVTLDGGLHQFQGREVAVHYPSDFQTTWRTSV